MSHSLHTDVCAMHTVYAFDHNDADPQKNEKGLTT